MTWAELRRVCEQTLAEAGEERPARLVLDWFDDVFGRASRRDTEVIPAQSIGLALRQLEELSGGRPLAYVTGIAHFYGYEFEIAEGVLIPRPETEELVRWILEAFPQGSTVHFADLCTGSGCIAAALALQRLRWRGVALDISPYAIDITRRNVSKHALGDHIEVIKTDLLSRMSVELPLPKLVLEAQSLDLMVSNPPYIPDADWHRVAASVASYEPRLALWVDDADPLMFYRRILGLGQEALRPGGWLYFECNDRFVREVVNLLLDAGLQSVEIFTDMQGKERHVRGQVAMG